MSRVVERAIRTLGQDPEALERLAADLETAAASRGLFVRLNAASAAGELRGEADRIARQEAAKVKP